MTWANNWQIVQLKVGATIHRFPDVGSELLHHHIPKIDRFPVICELNR